jgi:hypothetical protein
MDEVGLCANNVILRRLILDGAEDGHFGSFFLSHQKTDGPADEAPTSGGAIFLQHERAMASELYYIIGWGNTPSLLPKN